MRILKQLAISLGVAAVVFVIVIVAACHNMRGVPRICHRQWETQQAFRVVSRYIDQSKTENQKLPARLVDLSISNDPRLNIANGDILDAWNRPIQYETSGDAYVLMSLGRDGLPAAPGLTPICTPMIEIRISRRRPFTNF